MPSTGSPQVRQYPKSAYGFYLAATILIAVCLETIIYLMMLGNTLGPFTLFKKEAPVNQAMTRDVKVAILYSQASAKMFAENPQSFDGPERLWERVLKLDGIPYRVISDAVSAQGLGDATVLVLPGSACLDDAQRKVIASFLGAGKGVVASGPVGTRDADCTWKGWDFLTRLTGAQSASSATPTTNIDVTFRGQQFFSQKIPSGLKLEIPSQELTLLAAPEPDAYLSDWMLRPAEGRKISEVALAVHRVASSGRLVWFGFSNILPADRDIDQTRLNSYLTSAVDWTGKQPLAVLGNWPKMNASAALVAIGVQQNFANAASLSKLMKTEGVPATFFCASAGAAKIPDLIKEFDKVGEVASLGIAGEPLQGLLPRVQGERLHQSKLDLEKIVPTKVVGYAPPESLSDTATVVALNDAGYRYELNEMAVTRAVPEIVDFTSSVFFPFQKAEISKIFRASLDDYGVLANYRGPEPPGDDLAEGFLSDFRRINYLGGVYTLYIHSYLMGSPQYYPALRNVLEHIRNQSVWLTTGQDLVDWWTARNKVEIETSKVVGSAHRIRLDVANKGQTDVDNSSVYLYLPYHPKKVQINAIVFRLRSPKFELLDHDDILRVDFPRLSSQTSYTYVVQMDE
ncbi:MAG TPA: polysaccharide deacetylase family protein [Terriglobia bacterium]|nr:polysaccharide deacetylase family protein [Terriglobia bacterium]